MDQTEFGGSLDRRESNRFPLQQEMHYRVLNSKLDTLSGTGRTLDMSSTGILFSTEQRLQLGKLVEVAINWPARLDGRCALKFVAVGRVVRSEPHSAALRIERYEFRTRAIAQSVTA